MTVPAKMQQIVVVDDDLDIQELVSAYFKPKGFRVLCFTDANEAIRESLISGADWDVLLTDLRFPKMSAVDFTIQIHKTQPRLPVIHITVPEAAATAIAAVEKGAYDVVVKSPENPIQFAQLKISVERALKLKALNEDLLELREVVKAGGKSPEGIIGRSPRFLAALDVARRVAPSSASILISGETGVGKEVFTKFIHRESLVKSGPLISINCSAIPENLLESELFGHAKGSFTGADITKIGLFEAAENGTLFLDEIGDLSLALQAKLLRVLEEKKVRRVGENQDRPINCRIISATHKDLSLEINENRFREDLYFRLNVIPIFIPPLRERADDILPLAEHFLRRFALDNGSVARGFSKEAIRFVLENPWRGNIRELENSIQRAVVLSAVAEISLQDFLPSARSLKVSPNQTLISGDNCFAVQFDKLPMLNEVIRQYIEFAVERNGGARDRTAKEIGIDRKTLYRRMVEDPNTLQ